MTIPKLDNTAAMLLGAIALIDLVAFWMMGSPVSFAGYLFIPVGIASMMWSGWSWASPA